MRRHTNIERKKLIAREILWFGFFCVTTFLIIVILFIPAPPLYWGGPRMNFFYWLLFCEWIYDVRFVQFVIVLGSLYLFRGIAWAIETLWFSEKKQTKD